LELNGQLLFIGRGQVDLKTHVSAIDFEIDDDAVIREPRGFYARFATLFRTYNNIYRPWRGK
jgi:hypothetical protein